MQRTNPIFSGTFGLTTFEKKALVMNNEKHETMMALVNKWKGSGIPIRSYAQQIGVSKSKFEYWVRKQKAGTAAKVPFAEFIEVGSMTENREPVNDVTCTKNDIDPQKWLTYVIKNINDTKNPQLKFLLPQFIDKSLLV